jgi:cytidylate kinase
MSSERESVVQIEEVEAKLRQTYHGERRQRDRKTPGPLGVTVAVSREAGSRGSSIANRAAAKLGWQVYNQEILEYLAHESTHRHDLVDALAPELADWVERRLAQLTSERNLSSHPSLVQLARIVLALAATGEVVLIGRGAGNLLPRLSTLNVRTIAPVEDRVAYMSQWLRLPIDQAAEQVRLRDTQRNEFVEKYFHRRPGDPHQYDLLLNTSFLGEELSASLIVQAARAKQAALAGDES